MDWYEGPPPFEVSDEERTELTKLFGRWGEKPWTQRSSYELRMEVQHMWDDGGEQLGYMYKLALRESNLILHSSAWSVRRVLTRVEGTDAEFEGGPSRQFLYQALLFLMWSFAQVVGLAMDHFEMPDRQGFTDTFERANEAFRERP